MAVLIKCCFVRYYVLPFADTGGFFALDRLMVLFVYLAGSDTTVVVEFKESIAGPALSVESGASCLS